MRACYRTVFLTSLVASVLAVPALAQTQPALTNYPACSTKPSASDSEAAHSAFLLGKRFFDEADYGSAIHNFVDAYKLDCTKTELLTIIARAHGQPRRGGACPRDLPASRTEPSAGRSGADSEANR